MPHTQQYTPIWTIGGEIGETNEMVTKPTQVTEVGETAETPQYSPFEAAVLEGCKALNEYSSRISAEVDKAQVWDEKLNPAMLPIRQLVLNLSKAANGAIMDSPVIVDIDAALGEIGQTADFRAFALKAAEYATRLQPVEISTEAPESVIKAATDLKGVLDNSLIVLTLGEEVQNTAKAAMAAFNASETKRRNYALASKRAVPSKTGTKGASGASEPNVEKTVSVTYMSENGLSTYSTRNGEQGVSKAGHAIKEKLAESRGFGADLSKLPEEDKKLINDTLRELAENAQPGHMVQVPGIGTFTRK